MKKMIAMFSAVILVLSMCCTACSREGNKPKLYDSYVCDMMNDGIIQKAETDWWSVIRPNNPSAEQQKKLTYDGTTYNFVYSTSRGGRYDSFDIDRYTDSTHGIDISVIQGSNDIVGFHRWGLITDEYSFEPDVYATPESALPMARKIASRYIDVDEYRLDVEVVQMGKRAKEYKSYAFRFVRCIDDFYTSERVYVFISSKGDLITFHFRNLGLFKDKQISVDKDALEKSIKAKLDELYASNYAYDYTIERQTLAYTPGGDLAVVSQITVSLVDIGNTGVDLTTVIP